MLQSIAIEWLAAGGIVTAAGILVKYFQWTFLLAGYDGQSAVPDDVIAEIAGNTIFRVGLALIVFGGLASVTKPPTYLSTIFEVVIAVAVIRMIYKLNTYTPTKS